jgi:hypothetical protein
VRGHRDAWEAHPRHRCRPHRRWDHLHRAGVIAYVAVQQTLADQKIVVSDDASFEAGKPVNGPFSAYAQATVIGKHAKEIAGGKTYAELPQDDPNRDTVMTASFLQASLFTSVVAFGVSAMAAVLGVMLILLGWAVRKLSPQVVAKGGGRRVRKSAAV